MDSTGTRIWYHASVRDISGSVLMGIPERCALQLAHCDILAAFMNKHITGGLSMPLLCHGRVTRKIRGGGGATHSVQLVNHTMETVDETSWERSSAPNAAVNELLAILKQLPTARRGHSLRVLGGHPAGPGLRDTHLL